jgi:ABC-type spermidine/putrescine transport system permease subunit II
MNRGLFIILIPTVLVAAGYVIVLREMGFSPGYLRLIVAVALFLGTLYWLSHKAKRKEDSGLQ